MDYQILTRTLNLVFINKEKRTYHLVVGFFLTDRKVKIKQNEKISTFFDFAIELKNFWS